MAVSRISHSFLNIIIIKQLSLSFGVRIFTQIISMVKSNIALRNT